jgi:hypothetical protein
VGELAEFLENLTRSFITYDWLAIAPVVTGCLKLWAMVLVQE